MDCPVCKNAMITMELRDVEIDHCLECGGIWLDAGELELLIEDAQKSEELLKSFSVDEKNPERRRKCPICLKKMQKVLVGGEMQSQVLIDRCKNNHGLWFDAGELRDVLKKAKLDDDSKIQKLLADMFGIEEAEAEGENQE